MIGGNNMKQPTKHAIKWALAGAVALLVVSVSISIAAAEENGSPATGPYPYSEVTPLGQAAASSGGGGRVSAPARGSRGPVASISGKGGKTLQTGIGDPRYTSGTGDLPEQLFDETKAAGAGVVRIDALWREIAPDSRPSGFEPTDPGSPGYSWEELDAAVEGAASHGLRPILLVRDAPDWAEGKNRPKDVRPGVWKPNPGELADFGEAIATRYSGNFAGLPKVTDYLLWNEPTIPTWLMPQWKGKSGKKPASPEIYRKMLNAFYKSVHGVSRSNNVITAGTPPYGFPRGKYSMRPLLFWRTLLCMKGNGKKAKSRCAGKPKFDVLAHHPINTSGGPYRSALHPDDVATPDLHNLVRLLRRAEREKTTGTRGKHPVWATELWWESSPPDKGKETPSLSKQAAYYNEAFYLLWKQGARMVLTYLVRDEPQFGCDGLGAGCAYQTGLYFVDGKAKPSVGAMQFPFVADRKSKKKVLLWGKPPESGKLVVKDRGKKVAKFRVGAGKIFTKKVKLRGRAKLKAKVGASKSLAYKLK